MDNLIITPIIAPLIAALSLLIWNRPSTKRRLFTAVFIVFLQLVSLALAYGVHTQDFLVLNLGSWPAPYGITAIADLLSIIMVNLAVFIVMCSLIYGFCETPTQNEHRFQSPLILFLLAGINMSFLTGDLFNLFVAFEVMLIASYALMTLQTKDQDIRFGFSYVAINLFGSALFLCAAGLMYSLVGTLNFADIALKTQSMAGDPKLLAIAVMLTVVFGIKAGMFPLYAWLPKSYPILPPSLMALYGGLLTKVGVYAIIRLFSTILPHGLLSPHHTVLILSVPTMIFGVMGALSRDHIRTILSYHIISQVGFMLLAVGFFTPLAMAAAIFYIIHHIIVKASLFFIGGLAQTYQKSDELNKMGGLWKTAPLLGILFLCQALSLAGIPPLSGFWGKYLIIVVALKQEAFIFAIVSVLASVLTLISMLKIWLGAFWGQAKQDRVTAEKTGYRVAVVSLMVLVSLCIGLGAEFFFGIATRAAETVLNQQEYIQRVLL